MRVFSTMLLGVVATIGLSACSGGGSANEDTADFSPPTAQTRDDFAANLDRRFGRMDRNGDGAIQADEMQRRRGAGSDAGTAPGGATAAPARGQGRAAMLRALDADGDGEVTRGEFVDGSLARFDKADANHDKTLTSDERRASGLFGRRGGSAR